MKIFVKIILTTLLMLSVNRLVAQHLCTDGGNVWNKSWESCQESANPNSARGSSHWLYMAFDQLENIDSTHIWNGNISGESQNGVKNVIIDYTTDGNAWIELGTFTFPKANESENYSGFKGPNFGGVWVKEIVFTVIESYNPAGNCVSLAEIQIMLNPNACYGTIDVCGRCNGEGEITWYQDADDDGFGDPAIFTNACTQPEGFVANKSDECDNGLLAWKNVATVFRDNGCTGCHGAASLGGLNLETYEAFAQGGNKCGSNITTGTTLTDIIQIDNYSGCSTALTGESMNDRVGLQLDASEIATIQQWIDGGALENCQCTPLTNYALSGFPSMSSQFTSAMNATNLIDEVVNNTKSQLAHTSNNSLYEWVEIDLGAIKSVSEIVVENRTNCCSERLSNVYILASKTPFPNSTNLDEALENADFTEQFGNTTGESQLTVQLNQAARYIRLQKSGTNSGGNAINIRELRVFSGEESMDSDNDGICDAMDTCKDFDNNLIGTTCDDGKECTENDIYTEACNCAGTPKTDSDSDGVCDDLDVVPNDPCTADGSYDGLEPTDWLYINSFDCDGDGITSSQYDIDDFDSCQDQQGFRATSECACPDNTNITGLQLISSNGVRTSGNANGMPDGIVTANLSNTSDRIVFKTEYLLKGEEVCLALGFYHSNGVASITMNGYYFKFSNSANITGYRIQEVCYPVQIEGEQTVIITETGRSVIRVDGGYHKYCECAPSDPNRDELECSCPSTIMQQNHPVLASSTLQAGEYIQSNGMVDVNKQIVFKAGSYIELTNDFEVKSGAEFEAKIEACE